MIFNHHILYIIIQITNELKHKNRYRFDLIIPDLSDDRTIAQIIRRSIERGIPRLIVCVSDMRRTWLRCTKPIAKFIGNAVSTDQTNKMHGIRIKHGHL